MLDIFHDRIILLFGKFKLIFIYIIFKNYIIRYIIFIYYSKNSYNLFKHKLSKN